MDLIDQVKAMHSSVKDPKPPGQFFSNHPPNGRGGTTTDKGEARIPRDGTTWANQDGAPTNKSLGGTNKLTDYCAYKFF